MRIPLYFTIALCMSWGILSIVIGVFTCSPGPPGLTAEWGKQEVCLSTYQSVPDFLFSMIRSALE